MADAEMRIPQQERSRRTLGKILAASVEILADHGWDAVTMGEVERRSGVSRGSLYTRFPTREALLEYVSTEVMVRVREIQDAAFDCAEAQSRVDLEASARAAMHAAAEVFGRHGRLMARLDRGGENEAGRVSLAHLSDRFAGLVSPSLKSTPEAVSAVEFSIRLVFDSLVARTRGIDPFPAHAALSWERHLESLTAVVVDCLSPHRVAEPQSTDPK